MLKTYFIRIAVINLGKILFFSYLGMALVSCFGVNPNNIIPPFLLDIDADLGGKLQFSLEFFNQKGANLKAYLQDISTKGDEL
jgi:hypothetical protein